MLPFLPTLYQNLTKNIGTLARLEALTKSFVFTYPLLLISNLLINFFEKSSGSIDSFISDSISVIIDIISLCACVDNNFKVGDELKNLLFHENDIEVLSHVINAFMDIFKNDDLESNTYLRQIGVMDLFGKAVPQFKNKLKVSKKEGKMDQESIGYCKDTFLNMKRFIKYKEDNFKRLKI